MHAWPRTCVMLHAVAPATLMTLSASALLKPVPVRVTEAPGRSTDSLMPVSCIDTINGERDQPGLGYPTCPGSDRVQPSAIPK